MILSPRSRLMNRVPFLIMPRTIDAQGAVPEPAARHALECQQASAEAQVGAALDHLLERALPTRSARVSPFPCCLPERHCSMDHGSGTVTKGVCSWTGGLTVLCTGRRRAVDVSGCRCHVAASSEGNACIIGPLKATLSSPCGSMSASTRYYIRSLLSNLVSM